MLAAQSTGAPYTIHRTVGRVVLDVVVTDAHHQAVHGLANHDFSIFEDGQPQKIRSFEERDDANSTFTPPKLATLPPGTYMDLPSTAEHGPLYVIVYDAVHMRQEDQPQARQQLAGFLAQKPEGTRFALFLLADDFRMLQGFTTDQHQLLAAFDTHRKEGHIPFVFLMGLPFGATDMDLPFEVMSELARYLEGLPGRKNLIWISSEFPMSAGLILPVIQAWGQAGPAVGHTASGTTGGMPGPSSPLQAQGFDGVTSTPIDNARSSRIMREAIDALNDTQVSVYPVNVGGVRPDMAGVDMIADRIADVTGGHAYYNTNNFRRAMEEATENGANYYEITYAPSNTEENGKIRRIHVSLDRAGITLAYRRYYFAEDPNTPHTPNQKKAALATANLAVAHRPGDSMYAYMQHGAPEAHEVVFRVQIHAAPAALATTEQMKELADQPGRLAAARSGKPEKTGAPIPLQLYTVDYLVLDQSSAGAGPLTLELAAGAYDNEGRLLNSVSQNAVRDAASGKKPQSFVRAEQTLEVPTTTKWLRVGVRDVQTDRIGTLELPLPLPGQ